MLPPTANEHSHLRAELARRLTATCPTDLGRAIAITGSVARGVADRFSDLELRFLVDELAPAATYQAWLRSVGADVADHEDLFHAGAVGTKSWLNGVFVEALWQTTASFDADLRKVVDGETLDHWDLVGAWHVVHAVPLRPDPLLAEWQQRLATYPAGLQERLITQATQAWAEPHWWPLSTVNVWPLVYRDARLALAGKLMGEMERVLRIVFAINKQWEPDWKWLAPECERITTMPVDLFERTNAVFAAPDAADSVRICLRLILDTLALVPSHIDVALPTQQVRAALDPETLLPR